ncbi:MAG TPA: hypothetical protein VEC99_18360 [Clostridia bacterium]|nr:hypothetical protein [Clostridia bacterium]
MDYQTVSYKIKNGDYKSKLDYPAKFTKPQMPSFNQTAAAAREFADKLEHWEKNEAEYKRLRAEYNADVSRLEQVVFKSDLEAAHDLADHPKKDLLWAKAWGQGHSSGLSDVLYWYSDLAELL